MSRLNFIIRLTVCLLFIFLPLGHLDQWFYDQFFRLRGVLSKSTPFVLISVNDSKLFRRFSERGGTHSDESHAWETRSTAFWYREFYHTLVERLKSVSPELIVFISFYGGIDRPSSPPFAEEKMVFSSSITAENKIIPPSTALTRGTRYGFNNIFPDADNVVRKSPLVLSSGASLAFRVQTLLHTDFPNRDLIRPLWIDFRGPSGSYPIYDGWDIFEFGPSEQFLKKCRNKIILIGRETGPDGELETPIGRMSDLEIQANTIETYLDGRDIRMLPHGAALLLAALSVLVSIIIILLFPLSLASLLLVFFSILAMLVLLFIFSQFKIWVGVANPVVCVFVTHLLMLGYKLSRQEETQWKLQQETAYLKEMDRFKNNFLSLFSHDLKTPIAKIKAITDRLLTDNQSISPEIQQSLKTIDRTNSELARYISDILKVMKMESMSLELQKEVVDLNRLVEEAVQRLKFHADEKNLTIILDLEPLFSMEGDTQLLQEVVTNLLENAIKYSKTNTQIIIRTREEKNAVRVMVIDQGMGIGPDELPRVTSKFYRGKTAQGSTSGSGLGLYLAKYFLELHRGRLEIQSQLGKGTEVSFWLPLST